MRARRIAVVAAAGALVAGGAGAAIGATHNDKGKEAEAKILADAAKSLNVTPEKLRDALADAEDAQLDQAVKDGDLTQAQADEIKKRRAESGRVLGIPHAGPHGGPPPFAPRGRGMRFRGGPGHGPITDLAKALGITERQLFRQLRSGKSVAEIAKAEGKDLADVKATLKAAEKKRLDAAVKAGRLTQKQADEILSHIDERLDRLGERGFHRHGPPPPGAPPVPPPPQDEAP
jgi:transposase-like protein